MNFNIDIFAQCCKEIDKFDIAYLITGVYEPLLNLVDLSPVTCYVNLCGQIKDEQHKSNYFSSEGGHEGVDILLNKCTSAPPF